MPVATTASTLCHRRLDLEVLDDLDLDDRLVCRLTTP